MTRGWRSARSISPGCTIATGHRRKPPRPGDRTVHELGKFTGGTCAFCTLGQPHAVSAPGLMPTVVSTAADPGDAVQGGSTWRASFAVGTDLGDQHALAGKSSCDSALAALTQSEALSRRQRRQVLAGRRNEVYFAPSQVFA